MPSHIEFSETVFETVKTETPSQCVVEQDEGDENIGAEMEEEEEENGVPEYEQTREKRIKENMERMQKLGIFDASLQLKSAVLGSKGVRKKKALDFKNSPVREAYALPRPTRRSSRLQNATPVSYVEVEVEKKGNSTRSRDIYLEVGSKPEVYTEEHDKLLGECNMEWTLFVDGYGKDGKRIYDPVKGKTCHQCRQKTLGHRTTCSNCNMVQGQFCGDCLYMRYGEHVLEANQNPDWVCPPCRGICNCSLCRQAKGWAPTGPLYRKISSLGYQSVAHYLFQTRRSVADDDTEPQIKSSSKVEVPLADDVPSKKDELATVMAHQSEKDSARIRSENKEKKDADNDMNATHGHISNKSGVDPGIGDDDNATNAEVEMNGPATGFTNNQSALGVKDDSTQLEENGPGAELIGNKIAETECKPCMGISVCENNPSKNSNLLSNNNNTNQDEIQLTKGIRAPESIACINTPDKTSTRKRSRVTVAPSPDSIAGRLRLRRIGLLRIAST